VSEPPPSSAPVLAVHELSTYYGTSQVLFDVDLQVGRRGGVAVLGRNGAGKTTLMKTIVGELRPRRGRIELDGRDETRTPTEQRVRWGLGYVPQEHAVFARLTVRENLVIGAMAARGATRIDEVVALFPKLGQRLNQVAGTLSGGERKMLAVGRALLTRPKLLLLDEPTEGVWIGVIEEIGQRLVELAARISLVIVEQHLELALAVAAFAYVLDRGRVALAGPSEEVKHDPRLLRYLAP
jgi:branched-chain amino acid transport system ATP-binding protein